MDELLKKAIEEVEALEETPLAERLPDLPLGEELASYASDDGADDLGQHIQESKAIVDEGCATSLLNAESQLAGFRGGDPSRLADAFWSMADYIYCVRRHMRNRGGGLRLSLYRAKSHLCRYKLSGDSDMARLKYYYGWAWVHYSYRHFQTKDPADKKRMQAFRKAKQELRLQPA